MRKNLLMALLCLAVACVFASSALAEKVRYIEHGWDEVGQKLTTTTKTVNCTMLTENDETLSGGWYAAKGTPTYSSALKIRGDVNLILPDGPAGEEEMPAAEGMVPATDGADPAAQKGGRP